MPWVRLPSKSAKLEEIPLFGHLTPRGTLTACCRMGWKNCYMSWWSLLLLSSASPATALSPDESLLLARARAIAAAPLDNFAVLGRSGTMRDGGYRYQLA